MKRLIPLLLLVMAACGSSSGGKDGDTQDLLIIATFEAPPQAGRNALLIVIRDDSDRPVTNATMTVDPQMPTHGHGSTEDPVATETGDGQYRAEPVTFQMPGHWVVGIHAESEGRTGVFSLDVDVE